MFWGFCKLRSTPGFMKMWAEMQSMIKKYWVKETKFFRQPRRWTTCWPPHPGLPSPRWLVMARQVNKNVYQRYIFLYFSFIKSLWDCHFLCLGWHGVCSEVLSGCQVSEWVETFQSAVTCIVCTAGFIMSGGSCYVGGETVPETGDFVDSSTLTTSFYTQVQSW